MKITVEVPNNPTNADVYKAVYGMLVDYRSCPTALCHNCPTWNDKNKCSAYWTKIWWESAYKKE